MNCSDVHVAIGAEPHITSPELEAHLRQCASCARYRRELQELDERIRRALNVDLAALKPDTLAGSNVRLVHAAPAVPSAAAPSKWYVYMARQFALAASILLAIGAVLVLWGVLPRHSLAADIVAHVVSEPLPADGHTVPLSKLEDVLGKAHMHLDPPNRDVLFAQTCFLRGRLVPHFAIRSANGTVTVIVLPDENVKAPERFHHAGYSGILLPNPGHGSIAVLSRGNIDSEKQARKILSALHLQQQPA